MGVGEGFAHDDFLVAAETRKSPGAHREEIELRRPVIGQ
jgi:hypothetical protein